MKEKYPVHAETLNLKRPDKHIRDLIHVYNKAFCHFPHFKEITVKEVRTMFAQMKPIADPHVISFVYYDNTPAGICVMLPDIAPFLQFAKGRLSWWKRRGR